MTEPWADRDYLRGDAAAPVGEGVRLDDGESMARSFSRGSPDMTSRRSSASRTRSRSPEYVRSMAGTSRDADPERVARTVAAAFPRNPDGCYAITSRSGCLVCEVG